MTSRTRSLWKSFALGLLIVGCLCTKESAAQNGTCVVNTQQITYHCQGGCGKNGCTCVSQTTVTVPNGGYGDGQIYNTATTQCCGNTVSYLSSCGGSCIIYGGAVPVRQVAESGGNRVILLRGCDGRFKLYEVRS